jgi:hypothetical protein
MASGLQVFTTPPPRTFAIVYMLHLFKIAMFIYTMAYEKNPFVVVSMLLLFFWVYVWPSIKTIQVLYVEACNLLRYVWLPSLLRLAIVHTAQFIWTFQPPVATLPPHPSALTPEDRPVHDSHPVYEGFSVSSASDLPRARRGFRRVCHKFYVDSYLQVTFRFSG